MKIGNLIERYLRVVTRLLQWVLAILLIAMLIILGVDRISKDQTGFSSKTLWDWMQLLLVPVFLATAAYLFNQATREREQRLADQRAQTEHQIANNQLLEVTLQDYVDQITNLLLKEDLRDSKSNSPVQDIARVRTITTLRRLDGKRNDILLNFLVEAQLIGPLGHAVDLNQSDLSGIDLQNVNLLRLSFRGTNLSHANMKGAKLSAVDLEDADLRYAQLFEAILVGTKLVSAKLCGADLRKANLCEAQLGFADLSDANLSEANLSGYTEGASITSAKLIRANLKKANLAKADLSESDLSGADLRSANLNAANLEYANLTNTNLMNANLRGANLLGADLTGAKMRHADLMNAKLSKTIMPDGSRRE